MIFKDFLPNITEKEYRGLERVSYSFLKILSEVGPVAILQPPPEVLGDGLTLGSIVDKKLSDESYLVENDYIITDVKLDLSGDTHSVKILKFLRNNKDVFLEEGDTELLSRIFSILEFKRNPQLDASFWEQVKIVNLMNSGKNIVAQSEVDLAEVMVNTFLTHEYTKDFFEADFCEEIINQAVILFEHNGVKCKSLIDKIIINHDRKTIKLYDIKTGSRGFVDGFYEYKYYYQGGFYYMGLVKFIKSIPELSDYTVIPEFEFIYVGRSNPNIPLIYKMNAEWLNKSISGYESLSGIKVKGIEQLLEDYSWYKENEIYDISKEIHENRGVIELIPPRTWTTEKK